MDMIVKLKLIVLLPLISLLISFPFLLQATPVAFKYCDKFGDGSNAVVKVKTVELEPYPPFKGENLGIIISAITGKTIHGGYLLTSDVTRGIDHPILSPKAVLCEETPCPIKPGSFVILHSVPTPSSYPANNIKLELRLLSNTSIRVGHKKKKIHELTCITFDALLF